jgi:hypothetical protein
MTMTSGAELPPVEALGETMARASFFHKALFQLTPNGSTVLRAFCARTNYSESGWPEFERESDTNLIMTIYDAGHVFGPSVMDGAVLFQPIIEVLSENIKPSLRFVDLEKPVQFDVTRFGEEVWANHHKRIYEYIKHGTLPADIYDLERNRDSQGYISRSLLQIFHLFGKVMKPGNFTPVRMNFTYVSQTPVEENPFKI